MRILLLTQFFDPEPTLKGAAFARELRRHGHEVEVLTGFPNYPGGKVYDGYRIRPYTRETVDGVTIHRVALYPSHDRSPVRRVLNYMSFALMATLIGPFVVNRPDAIYVHHPPITITIPAAILSLTTGAPYVLEIQDLWPDTLRATGMFSSSLGGRIVGAWAKRAYALAARIVVISPGFRSALIGRGVPEQKIELVYNWGEEGRIRPEARDHSLMEQYGMLGRFNVLFAGTMGRAQGLDAVIDAAKITATTHPTIQFVMVGGGIDVDRLKARVSAEAVHNVRFLPRFRTEEMGRILPLADALLVHLRDDPLFKITVPSKTQAYMMAAQPVVMAVRGDAANLIERAGAGLTCQPEDPNAIAATVIRMFAMHEEERRAMGQRGKAYYDRELSLAVGVARYDRLLRNVMEQIS